MVWGSPARVQPNAGEEDKRPERRGTHNLSDFGLVSGAAVVPSGKSSVNGGTAPDAARVRSFTSRQKSWASLANMVIKHGTAATAKSNYTASSALNTANGSIASFIQVPTQNIGRGLTFSPTGQLLLHYGQGPDIVLIKSSDGSQVDTLRKTKGSIRFAEFSSDGKFLVAASDDFWVFVYDVTASVDRVSKLVSEINMTNEGGEAACFCLLSPNGDLVLTIDDDGQLATWRVEDGTFVQRYDTPDADSQHCSVYAAFTENGRTVVSCSDYECGIALFDTSSGEMLHCEMFELLQEGRNKADYVVSPDGKWVVVYIKDEQTTRYNVAVYNVAERSHKVYMLCGGAVLNATFNPKTRCIVLCGRDSLIHLFDVATMESRGVLQGHDADVRCCSISRDGEHAISVDKAAQVLVWDLHTSAPLLRLQAPLSQNASLVYCDVSVDGMRAFTLDDEGHAHLWYLEMQGMFKVLMTDSELLSCFEIAPRQCSMVVGYADGMLRMWTFGLKAQQEWWHCQHSCSVECLSINPSGNVVVSGSRDGMMVLSNFSDGQVLGVVQAHDDVVTSLAFNTDGSMLLSSARDGVLWVWDTSTPGGTRPGASANGASGTLSAKLGLQPGQPRMKPVRLLRPPGEDVSVQRCCLDPKGNKAVAGFISGVLAIWDAHTGAIDTAMAVANVGVSALAFAHNGRYLIAGSADGAAVIVEMETFKVLCRLDENASGLNDVYFETGITDLSELHCVTVCSRQAVAWNLTSPRTSGGAPVATPVAVADFIAGRHDAFLMGAPTTRGVFIAHQGLAIYDPQLKAVMYHMEEYEEHPGNSSGFRKGTVVLQGGVSNERLVMYAPPDKTVSVLMNETGCVTCLDFSTDGRLLVSGSKRGELIIWDIIHRQPIIQWMAHKRSAVHCVKFSHDSKQVYSCGEDCKVLLWNWNNPDRPDGSLVGHSHPVVCVEMSLDKTSMVSGDKNGTVVIWDAVALIAKQVINVHDGAVLCCSISPDGSRIISSGADEHICIIDAKTGEEILHLDEVLDGAGLTAKFSFDGTRVQIGGEKGNILIWSVESNCLLYDIEAHVGSVYDCSWSGDSRWLLSVGTDGKARLWDAAAGSELCQASFENGFGSIDTGGFVKCDLSQDGAIMAGCTAKGHLMQWEVGLELRRAPNGQMLFHWLASMPAAKARELYVQLLREHPLLYNVQDGRGLTLLMHAAANGNPTIVNIIVGSIRPKQGSLGLMTSRLQSQALNEGSHHDEGETIKRLQSVPTYSSIKLLTSAWAEGEAAPKGGKRSKAEEQATHLQELNAISIAIKANNSDCVDLVLNAVLEEKVTPGSYHPVTSALCELAEQYPTMCEVFLTRLPLRLLGEMEIPNSLAQQGMLVKAATSYTSYRELWDEALQLSQVPKGPMVVMEAVMVQLPFANSFGANSLLNELVESDVDVKTFGSDTVATVIEYKWRKFAKVRIYTNTVIYLSYMILFTVYAIILSQDPGPAQTVYLPGAVDDTSNATGTCPYPDWSNSSAVTDYCTSLLGMGMGGSSNSSNSSDSSDGIDDNSTDSSGIGSDLVAVEAGVSFVGLTMSSYGRATLSLSFIIFFYSCWFMNIKLTQLATLGVKQFFVSFWNVMDLMAYTIATIIPPCVLFRVGMNDGGFVYPLVAAEVILLWTKSFFYGLAVDGLGTFIFMIIEILKGLKYFYLLLLMVYVAFDVALLNLCRGPPSGNPEYEVFPFYDSFTVTMLSLWQSTFQNEDARGALGLMYATPAIIVLCLCTFLTNVIMINLIVTLMNTLYQQIKVTEDFVFRRNRAELVMEVETTMRAGEVDEYGHPPPYLHVLRPINIQDKIQAYDQFHESLALEMAAEPLPKEDKNHTHATHVLSLDRTVPPPGQALPPTRRRSSYGEASGLPPPPGAGLLFGKIDEEGDYLPGVTPPATAGARNLGRVMSRQASVMGSMRPSSRHMNRNLSRQASASSALPKTTAVGTRAGTRKSTDMPMPIIGEVSGASGRGVGADGVMRSSMTGSEVLLVDVQRKLGDIQSEMKRLGASQRELQRQVSGTESLHLGTAGVGVGPGGQSAAGRWGESPTAAAAARALGSLAAPGVSALAPPGRSPYKSSPGNIEGAGGGYDAHGSGSGAGMGALGGASSFSRSQVGSGVAAGSLQPVPETLALEESSKDVLEMAHDLEIFDRSSVPDVATLKKTE